MSLTVVLPFCAKDGALALKNLLWMEELDGKLPFNCILSHDTSTPPEIIRDMKIVAERVFRSVDVFWYPAPMKLYWPAAPNWAWQNVARYCEYKLKGSWLFVEADAVPIRRNWLQDIDAEHIKGGRPFSGHIVAGLGHVNGSCVYPPNVSAFSQSAMRTEETAWDVVLGADLALREGGVSTHVYASHALFQHCWAINPADGKAWNGSGEVATFKSINDVLRLVDVTMALFHRCKDGSLIDWLRIYHKDPSAAMVPQHTNEAKPVSVGDGDSGLGKQRDLEGIQNDKNRPENSSDSDVQPEQPKVDPVVPKEPVTEGLAQVSGEADPGIVPVNPKPFNGKCEIFIVTYGLPTKRVSGLVVSDFDWLTWCLRSIRRHCTGFSGITLAIPSRDAELLKPIAAEHAQAKGGIPLRIKMFTEKPGKGHIGHMAVMGSADEFVPKDTTHVLHVDCDVIFREATTPSRYIHDGKPEYVVRTYDSLAETRDGQKAVSDCAQWKEPTAAQLGFEPEMYTMCCHPVGFPISFYKPYREHIEKLHGKPYLEYMLSGRNEFPPSRMDFTAMGAWAWANMREAFDWVDISGGNHLAPHENHRCFWSHGSVTDTIKTEIEGLLK